MVKPQKKDRKLIISYAKDVILHEINALKSLFQKGFDRNFVDLIESILLLKGKVILSGVGKSGLVARKISATLVSTGTPSVFIHPVEALHGDMGLVNNNDIAILFSNSGQSPEIVRFAHYLSKRAIKLYSVTNQKDSKLSNYSTSVILLHTPAEACPHNLVPTSSTTAMLAFGDAVAITVMKLKKYTRKDLGATHPGGNIGRIIYLKASDIMRRGKDNPIINYKAKVIDAVKVMTETSLGAVSVVDSKGRLVGFFTDGDIRRNIKSIKPDDPIKLYMTKKPVKINITATAIEVAKILEEKKVDNLPVIDNSGRVIGIIDERDLIREGIL
ncbi:MAG: KpsF/GutQ family sugar-phosphate isomerase [Elusimicrobiales bacterium]